MKALEIALILTAYDKATRVLNDAVSKQEKRLKDLAKSGREVFSKGLAQAGAGVAMAMPLIEATKSAVAFEDAMADVAKVMNITVGSADFTKMGEQAKDVAEAMGIGATESAKMMANLAAGGVADGELKQVAMMAGQMGIAFNMSADQAGTSFIKIKNALNQPIGETKVLMDQINMLSDSMASEANEIVSYMASGGSSVAASFKIAGAASAAFGSTLISVGKSSSEAATIMERFTKGIFKNEDMKAMFDQAGGGAAGLMAVLDAGRNSADPFEFFKSFGEYGTDINMLAQNFDLLSEAVKSTGDATKFTDSVQKEFNNRNSTTAGQMRRLKASFEVLVIDIGNFFIPILQKVVAFIKPIVTYIRDWAKEHPQLTKGIIAVTAAISGMMIAVGIFNMIRGAVMMLNVVLMMNPFILVATAAIVAVTLIYTYWDKIKLFFAKLWDNIKAIFKRVWEWIKNLLVMMSPVLLIYKHWDKITAWFRDLWEKVKTVFVGIWKWFINLHIKMMEAGKNLMEGLWEGIKAMAYKPIEAVKEIGTAIKNQFKDILGIKSPSKVFMEFGGHISGGASLGIKKGIGKAREATQQLAGAIGAPAAIPAGGYGGGSTSVNYSPVINITGSGAAAKDDLMAVLRKHQTELMRMIEDAQARKARAAF